MLQIYYTYNFVTVKRVVRFWISTQFLFINFHTIYFIYKSLNARRVQVYNFHKITFLLNIIRIRQIHCSVQMRRVRFTGTL